MEEAADISENNLTSDNEPAQKVLKLQFHQILQLTEAKKAVDRNINLVTFQL